jgi:hypothetical protein
MLFTCGPATEERLLPAGTVHLNLAYDAKVMRALEQHAEHQVAIAPHLYKTVVDLCQRICRKRQAH